MSRKEAESLSALEHLMGEFYLPCTSNARKHEIEVQLANFSGQPDSWRLCVYFLGNTSNQYVAMYALSTIEAVINRQWGNLDWEQRSVLKCSLYSYLAEQDSTSSPYLIRNKLAKLIVDIARFDWPQYFPEFFTSIIALLESKDHGRLLGLVLLRTASEEFMSPRMDMSSVRKEELAKLLHGNIPQIFQILCTILEELGSKPRHAATATPPPSPTHPSSAPHFTQEMLSASFAPDRKTITKETLATVQHLFTWTNLQQVPVPLIKSIFHFTNISSYAQDDDDTCILAMSALNELLYRKCAPPGTQGMFAQLYQYLLQLLRDIVQPAYNRIETLGNDFVEKLSELLVLLVEQQHTWQPEFFLLLFELTLQLSSVSCYILCLTVWVAFVKRLKPPDSHKYAETLLELANVVLNKVQFQFNHGQLEEIQAYYTDEEIDTEWNVFLSASIELLSLIAENFPGETFNSLLSRWSALDEIYCTLDNLVDKHGDCELKINPAEHARLNFILRDFSSLTEILARLSRVFLDAGNDKTCLPLTTDLMDKFVRTARVGTDANFYRLKSQHSTVFIQLHTQILAALKTWLPDNLDSHHLKQLLTLSIPLVCDAHPPPAKIASSAACLLLAISASAFPPALLAHPVTLHLIRTAPSLRQQASEIVNKAVCNILIRPWGQLTHEDETHRNTLVLCYFDALTRDFRAIATHGTPNEVKEIVTFTFPTLICIVEQAENFNSQSKKLLYGGLKPSVEVALKVFADFHDCAEVSSCVLALFLNVVSVLQRQLGAENTKQAVGIFLDVAIKTKNLNGLDKLLQILQIVVETQGSSYKLFLPDILRLCLEHVYPCVVHNANEQPDIIIALLALLHSALVHRWQYFYVSQVRLGYSPGCSENEPGPDLPQNAEQLLAILQVFGQTLMQSDINIFRASLLALENLNARWKLYGKPLFRDRLMNLFLTVLFQTLLNRSHLLLTDDIILAIYNMAAVNFNSFFNVFLTEFLQNMEGLTESQRAVLKESFTHEIDTPTFIQQLERFTNDVCCYKFSNGFAHLQS